MIYAPSRSCAGCSGPTQGGPRKVVTAFGSRFCAGCGHASTVCGCDPAGVPRPPRPSSAIVGRRRRADSKDGFDAAEAHDAAALPVLPSSQLGHSVSEATFSAVQAPSCEQRTPVLPEQLGARIATPSLAAEIREVLQSELRPLGDTVAQLSKEMKDLSSSLDLPSLLAGFQDCRAELAKMRAVVQTPAEYTLQVTSPEFGSQSSGLATLTQPGLSNIAEKIGQILHEVQAIKAESSQQVRAELAAASAATAAAPSGVLEEIRKVRSELDPSVVIREVHSLKKACNFSALVEAIRKVQIRVDFSEVLEEIRASRGDLAHVAEGVEGLKAGLDRSLARSASEPSKAVSNAPTSGSRAASRFRASLDAAPLDDDFRSARTDGATELLTEWTTRTCPPAAAGGASHLQVIRGIRDGHARAESDLSNVIKEVVTEIEKVKTEIDFSQVIGAVKTEIQSIKAVAECPQQDTLQIHKDFVSSKSNCVEGHLSEVLSEGIAEIGKAKSQAMWDLSEVTGAIEKAMEIFKDVWWVKNEAEVANIINEIKTKKREPSHGVSTIEDGGLSILSALVTEMQKQRGHISDMATHVSALIGEVQKVGERTMEVGSAQKLPWAANAVADGPLLTKTDENDAGDIVELKQEMTLEVSDAVKTAKSQIAQQISELRSLVDPSFGT